MEYRIVPGADEASASPQRMVGRCEMFDEIACGGMATIHLGRMLGAGGFTRTVAIKRLHPQYAKDPEFVNMFLDEARIVARIRHPNVVPTLDLVEEDGDLYIIMEYVEGVNFGELMKVGRKRKERVPLGAALRIVVGMLHGLHAAHEATNEQGEKMGLVHRDISPDNALVGVDGFPRVLDFGVARAMGRLSSTRDGQIKGKLSYMAPEQVLGEEVDARTDVFACAAVLWQALTGKRLFKAKQLVELTHKILTMEVPKPSDLVGNLPKKFDSIVLKGLEREPDKRWSSALAMAEAIEAVGHLASHREVGLWVRKLGSGRLSQLASKVSALEQKPVKRRSRAARRVEQRSRLLIDEAERAAVLQEIEADKKAQGPPPLPGGPPRPGPPRPGAPTAPPRRSAPPARRERNDDADDSGEYAALRSGEIPTSSAAPEQPGRLDAFDSGELPVPEEVREAGPPSSDDIPVPPALQAAATPTTTEPQQAATPDAPEQPSAGVERDRATSLAALATSKLPEAISRRPLLWGGAVAGGLMLLVVLFSAIGDDGEQETAAAATASSTTRGAATPPAPPATQATATAAPTTEPAPTAEPATDAEADAGADADAGTDATATATATPTPPVARPQPRPTTTRPRPRPRPTSIYSRQ